MDKLGVSISLNSGYHPQANGQVEWANKEVDGSSWHSVPRTRENGPSFFTGPNMPKTLWGTQWLTWPPFSVFWGISPPYFLETPLPQKFPLLTSVSRRMSRCGLRLLLTDWGQTFTHNQRKWDWLATRDLRWPTNCWKLSLRHIGPYKGQNVRHKNYIMCRLDLPCHSRVKIAYHVSQLKLVVSGPLVTHARSMDGCLKELVEWDHCVFMCLGFVIWLSMCCSFWV